jgi:hypothetical protein
MKRLLLAAALISTVFVACDDNDNPQPDTGKNPGTTLPEYHWIPNWSNDTLYCILSGGMGSAIKDTLYSLKDKDTSLIIYKGVRYYVWTIANPFMPNAKTYNNSFIGSKPFSNDNALAGHIQFVVEPATYFSDVTQRLEKQEQLIEDRGLSYFPAPPFQESVKIFSTKYKSW